MTGTISGAPLALNVVFTLAQSGNNVSGTFLADGGTSGTIAGIVVGASANFTITQTVPCAGTFNGTATITNSGARLSGTYTGTSPCTGPVSATFVVDRS